MFEPLTSAARAATLVAVAGRELNDEMTIIATAVTVALALLDLDHPARPYLLDARAAAQRCCWKSHSMLVYADRMGARRTSASLDGLLAQEVL